MGAWGYEVLSNDRALDTMYDLIDSKNLKEDIEKLLEYGDREEMVLACEIVDISINGIDKKILGNLYKYEDFFESIQNKSMIDLKLKALEKIRYIQRYDNGWIDRVKEQQANLLNEIENRLMLD